MTYKVALGTACGGKKNEGILPAHLLYKSPRIRALFNAAGSLPFFILSAEHGLVSADKPLSAYQRVMDDARAQLLAPQVAEVLRNFDFFVFFSAGARPVYAECMRIASSLSGVPVVFVGYGNMGDFRKCIDIAHVLHASGTIDTTCRSVDVDRPAPRRHRAKQAFQDSATVCEWLHRSLEVLPLISFPFRIDLLPENGVYFFYEDGEQWGHGGNFNRVVRVGTHKDGNFRSRISEHYLLNPARMEFDAMQAAPHERSIFRKHLGRAILNRARDPYLAIWELDFTSRDSRENNFRLRDVGKEREIESQVTDLLRERFRFRFIEIEGQQQRMGTNGLESALIGTFSHCSMCAASKDWFGRFSTKATVRDSGLWLVQHLSAAPLDAEQKDRIECATAETMARYDRRFTSFGAVNQPPRA